MKGSCSTVLESLELVVLVLGERILVHLSITVFEEPINCNVGNPIIAVMLELMSKRNEKKRGPGRGASASASAPLRDRCYAHLNLPFHTTRDRYP